jgi:hypothetical protein
VLALSFAGKNPLYCSYLVTTPTAQCQSRLYAQFVAETPTYDTFTAGLYRCSAHSAMGSVMALALALALFAL